MWCAAVPAVLTKVIRRLRFQIQVFNSVDKSSKSPLVNGTFEYSTYATMGVLKAAEEAHQVADLGKCLGLTFRANEAKFLQKLIEVEVFEAEGKSIALS